MLIWLAVNQTNNMVGFHLKLENLRNSSKQNTGFHLKSCQTRTIGGDEVSIISRSHDESYLNHTLM